MALQLIYTSASAALKPGVTGFATVAQHRGIRAAIVRAIEQRSGYLDSAAHGGKRPAVFAFRRIEAAGERAYVLSRVVASGADYTGRNNHLAHHLVVTDAELENLQLSPADVMLQMKWEDRWDKEPQYFSETDEIRLSAMKPVLALPARKWPSWPKGGAWDAACAAIPFSSNDSKDARSFFAVADVEDTGRLLGLYGESLLLKDPDRTRPAMMWQIPFTTLEIQAEDAQEFQWIGCVHGSPRHVELMKQRRSIIDLAAATLAPPSGELAEIARSAAAAPRKTPHQAKAAGGIIPMPSMPDVPPPVVAEARKNRREKKRDYEKEMLAHIEGADVDDKSLKERLMPLVIGVALIFLGLVAWQVYQELTVKKQREVARANRKTVEEELHSLQNTFTQGNDVSEKARALDKSPAFAALPEQDPLRERLNQLLQQLDNWQSIRSKIRNFSEQQLKLTPVEDAALNTADAELKEVPLPHAIWETLNKELGALRAEQTEMNKIITAKKNGVDRGNSGEKIRLKGIVDTLVREEVKKGMGKIVDELFPEQKVADTMKPTPPKKETKKEEAAAPKIKETAIDSNPNIAMLQRMPPTYVVPRLGEKISYAAINELKTAIGIMTAEDAQSSTISVAEVDHGPSPAAGVINALDGNAQFTHYRIAGAIVYDEKNNKVMGLGGNSISLEQGLPIWKTDTRYVFSFSKEKPAPGVPAQRSPDLQVLAVNPALTIQDALNQAPLLTVPAADFLVRDGFKILIRSGADPDLRKLLAKLQLVEDDGRYTFTSNWAPTLKRGDKTPVPELESSGAFNDMQQMIQGLVLDLGTEVQALQQTATQAEGARLKAESEKWNALVAAKALASKTMPPDLTGLGSLLSPFGPGAKPLLRLEILAKDYQPIKVTNPPASYRPVAVYYDILARLLTYLSSQNPPMIYLTAEDIKLKAVIEKYGKQENWITADAWTESLAAYETLVKALPETEKDIKANWDRANFPENTDDQKKQKIRINRHRWKMREVVLGWAKTVLNPKSMESMKPFLTWSAEAIEPAAAATASLAAYEKWKSNSELLNRLTQDTPSQLGVRYTLLLSFPFEANTQQGRGYIKWIEFTGQPEAAPAIPQPPPAPKP